MYGWAVAGRCRRCEVRGRRRIRHSVGSGSQRTRLGADVFIPWQQATGTHQIDAVRSQEFLEVFQQPPDVEQRGAVVEVDQQVDVAVEFVLTSRRRSEDPNTRGSM